MKNHVQAPWLITEDDPNNSEYLLVHNFYTDSTFRLQKKLAGAPLGKGVSEAWRDFMIAEKLIVRKEDILPAIEERLRHIMHGFESNTAMVVFNPTNSCQLDCVYCYNSRVRGQALGKKRLSPEEIAARIIAFYESTPAQTWEFVVTGGGEPTLATDYLCAVAKKIKARAVREGRSFEFKLTSNGHSLTKENVSKLVKAGLNRVQVTFDPEHDQTRPLKGGKKSFAEIFNNVKNLPAEVGLVLGSNLRPGEEEKFRKLLKKLKPLRDRSENIRAVQVMKKVPPTPVKSGKGSMSRMFGPKEIKTALQCLDAMDDAGFVRKIEFPSIHCEAFSNSMTYTINFAGETTFCPAMDGMPEYSCDPLSKKARRKFDMRLANPDWKDHCFDAGTPCAFLPACWGGCRMISHTQGWAWDTINCEKPMMDRMTRYELARWAEVYSM